MRQPAGSSLVECLVALAVLAIGSACHATWVGHSLAVHARASRSLAATTLAATLAERMRRNPQAWEQGLYTKAASSPACLSTCHPHSLAADDLAAFQRDLGAHMGRAAEGHVECGTATDCIIRITWKGREELAWPVTLPGA